MSYYAVLFSPPLIPAGIRRNSRIPAESAGIDWNSGGIHRNGPEFWRNPQEWTIIGRDGVWNLHFFPV